MTHKTRRRIRRAVFSLTVFSPPSGFLMSLALTGVVLARPAAAQADDLCFPEEFSTTNAIYFPFEDDVTINFQWFSLPAQRELVHSFPSDTEFVGVIDAYDLGSRFTFLGTHTNQTVVSLETCFASALPEPVQEPVCFGQGLERQPPINVAHSPLNRSTGDDTVTPGLVRIDGTWTEVGSVSVPSRLIERIVGRPLLALEFWNTRLEVDPAIFEIPDICDGVSRASQASDLSPLADRLRELYGEPSREQLRHLPILHSLAPR
ncbi:MAG: hypothetical protein AAF560_18535 [Acidobacteriota bacterium]